jgi:ATP-binding cassette subfamily B protein
LFALVVVRSLQLPLVTWSIAGVIGGPIARHDVRGTVLGALGFLGLVLLTELVLVFRSYLALVLGESIAFDMRAELQAHLLRQPMSFFHRMPLGRLISRMTSDIDQVRVGVQDVFFVGIVQVGSMLLAATLMLYYDYRLFLVVLLMVPLLMWLVRSFTARLSQAHRDVQETYSRLTSSLAESVNGIRVIQGFSRQTRNDERFGSLISVHAKNNMRAARQGALLVPTLEFNGQLFLAIVVVVGGYWAVVGTTDFTALVQFLFLAGFLFGPIPVLGRLYDQALSAMAGAERVFGLLDRQPEWVDEAAARPLEQIDGGVEFRDVSFGYDPEEPVLHRISFSVSPGCTVALVGETGSGKTTITRLLSKLYLPGSGSITIDGKDLRDVASPSLHRSLGCVPQDNYLWSGSVRENIRFARPEASDEDILDILRRLDILDLLEELPEELDTQVGEKGASLSLGQRQLVCFARALLADPKLLVLDEATSSVDALTEDRLQRSLARLLEGRTSFIVAHRLSTIRKADLILVLSRGQLVESGTHTELLARNGAYTRLYRDYAQAGIAEGSVSGRPEAEALRATDQ